VAEKLGAWGYEVSTGIGGTGVVGQLRRGTSTRTLGLRADMDALPIAEATGAAWASSTA
jgi:hippurate hydrolase